MPQSSNLLISSLSPGDAAALRPILKPVQLKQQALLFEAGDSIDTVYFPTGAIISNVIGLSTGEMVETAMVGRDGVIGASAALDGRLSTSRAIVQMSGPAIVCDASALKTATLQSNSLLSILARHEQALLLQAQQSAICLAAHRTEPRLCRWLLRARDLAGSDTLTFTQEFLAEMLGVRRTSVTVVAKTLQQAGLIKYSRGKIQITDIESLEDTACECYATVKSRYDELLGLHEKR